MTTSTDKQDQRSLALWAADCAEQVLPFFEQKHPWDNRPRKAIEAARAWVRGEIKCGAACNAAVAAHAAARSTDDAAACAVAQATSHAAGTAQMPDHARQAAAYALKALAEKWNVDHLRDQPITTYGFLDCDITEPQRPRNQK
ncbi:MAG TPA: hypothetical protein VH251_08910 [Verrucomicrobiae bacterium]|jgi:hypothetical protein|nr:hypothetical protein [Verrucomicrobiae bacterium]